MCVPVGRVYKNRNGKDNKNCVSNSLKNYMSTICQPHKKKKRKEKEEEQKQWSLPIQTENEPTLWRFVAKDHHQFMRLAIHTEKLESYVHLDDGGKGIPIQFWAT